MWEIQERLADAFEPFYTQLIQQNCQYNWDRKRQQGHHIQQKCIAKRLVELRLCKDLSKHIQAYPLTLPNAFKDVVVLECDYHPGHGEVFKDNEECHR